MLGAAIAFETAKLLSAKFVFGKHPFDSFSDHELRLFFKKRFIVFILKGSFLFVYNAFQLLKL